MALMSGCCVSYNDLLLVSMPYVVHIIYCIDTRVTCVDEYKLT